MQYNDAYENSSPSKKDAKILDSSLDNKVLTNYFLELYDHKNKDSIEKCRNKVNNYIKSKDMEINKESKINSNNNTVRPSINIKRKFDNLPFTPHKSVIH